MKILKSYSAFIVVMMLFCVNNGFAQAGNNENVPQSVITAFTSKYPKAEVKKWKAADNQFIASAKEGRQKYFAVFDKNGAWVKTVSTHVWPFGLSPAVKKALAKSEYGAWHIYGYNMVDSPAGQFCQVLVDDSNHRINARHNELVTENKMVEFKTDGQFIAANEVPKNSAF